MGSAPFPLFAPFCNCENRKRSITTKIAYDIIIKDKGMKPISWRIKAMNNLLRIIFNPGKVAQLNRANRKK